ncbi:zinc finger protein CONSTANS-LIKE 6 [Amborella trichopoda]|uniref:CCT domain-containing protein n=1 Tax=Amborella trichopoda TaxID=13333 RepID=W1NNG9_AMBTC|nr:zinc finger protein CONSTANS-LIKE 6 [Amborella trichopoda]ERM97317.1 hypothetical protein AMTR_s00073p00061640 [Amborella trichopoda]|eukprot:XP_006829901.1 zinc finger protein CONSTANS-LIKE 6 [Amborella trichopoda]
MTSSAESRRAVVAAAAGAKTVRPCDSCGKGRARWYCAADDAFLCHACDGTIHSANSVARRHDRVRLKTSSSHRCEFVLPSWQRGKARSMRPHPNMKNPIDGAKPHANPLVVPQMQEESSPDEVDEQLLYQVPVFEPMAADLRSSPARATPADCKPTIDTPAEMAVAKFSAIPSLDMDLADFAADVESLLGQGLDEDAFGIEGLGLLDNYREEEEGVASRVKVEEEEDEDGIFGCSHHPDVAEVELSSETLEFNFDYDTPTTAGEDDEEKCRIVLEKSISLRLDYEAVISAWGRSPWTTGQRPEFNPDDCWPDPFTGNCVPEMSTYSEVGNATASDGGREARVSRYREKRRTRLFSKKIRYEVRKLNAEKRPRMKGRFVKRTSFPPTPYPF